MNIIFTHTNKISSFILKKLNVNRIINILKFKTKDAVYLKIKNKKFIININDVKFFNFEIREIKSQIINHYYFNKIKINHVLKEHLFNFLLNELQDFNRKASLIKYLNDHSYSVQTVKSPFLSKDDRFLFSKSKINIPEIKLNLHFLNKFLGLFKILFFILIQRMNFYKLRKKYPEKNSKYELNLSYTTILKAFGLHAELIYLNKLNKSLENTIIYVKPYLKGKGLIRQIEYINHLKSNNRFYFFYVPKFNLKNAMIMSFKVFLMAFPHELKLPLIQILIKENEIDNFIHYILGKFQQFKEFYTSEEFETESIYLTKKLQDNNIKVINFAHGLGDYGNFIRYDKFYIISKIQREQYLGTSNFQIYSSQEAFKMKSFDKNKKLALFFIGQTFLSDYNSRTFKSYYKKAISFIEQIISDSNIPIYAKYHPESTKEDKILSERIKIVENLADLPSDFNYISLTLGSTYVIELLNIMPFLIINPSNKIDLKNYSLPNNHYFFVKDYQEFKRMIAKLSQNSKYYFEYWKELCNILNNIMN